MESYILKIIDFYIEINFHKSVWVFYRQVLMFEIVRFYKPFIIKEKIHKIHFTVDFKDKDKIDFCNKKNGYYVRFFDKLTDTRIITNYSISITQFQTILYYVLSFLLYNNDFIMLHGSGAIINNKAQIFLAPSSGGKSTIIRLLYGSFPIIGDDSIILKFIDNRLFCFLSPFKEKQWWVKKTNSKYLVDKLLFLKKSKKIKLERISDKNGLISLLQNQILFGMENYQDYKKNILSFLYQLIKFNHLYFFFFPKTKKLSKIILEHFQ